nr:MAG TPA: hypothetical protein [Bacteriophage sp.]DAS94988.1 MAG TPA: hypothetical protein [Caudoviricetes sp.]DAY37534.1 MAG TPA: hypothetical protein [Caudoviricetes sp.]
MQNLTAFYFSIKCLRKQKKKIKRKTAKWLISTNLRIKLL